MKWRFRPSLWTVLLLIVGMVFTASLGRWQLQRADEKKEMQRNFDLGEKLPAQDVELPSQVRSLAEYRRVKLTGVFDSDRTFFLDNRIHQGRAGFHVIAPIRLTGGGEVLVNRGWIAKSGLATDLPALKTPVGVIRIEGVVRPLTGRHIELANQKAAKIWQNISNERVSEAFGPQIPMRLIYQYNDISDGLVRVWDRPDFGVDKHLGYAGQWFLMCVTMFIIWIVLNVRRV